MIKKITVIEMHHFLCKTVHSERCSQFYFSKCDANKALQYTDNSYWTIGPGFHYISIWIKIEILTEVVSSYLFFITNT